MVEDLVGKKAYIGENGFFGFFNEGDTEALTLLRTLDRGIEFSKVEDFLLMFTYFMDQGRLKVYDSGLLLPLLSLTPEVYKN